MSRRLPPSLLAWLRAFEAAARHRSFTLAGKELHVTQGAISQQIRNLEQRLKRPLFIRLPRGLALTADGHRLQGVVSEAYSQIAAVINELSLPAKGQKLTIGCAPSFALRWLTPRLSDFFRRHPDADLRVHGETFNYDLERMLREGVGGAIRYGVGGYRGMRATCFLDEWLLPVASPLFVDSHPELKSPADLQAQWLLHDNEPWIGAEDYAEWKYWLDAQRISLPDFNQGRHFNLSQMAVSAALADQGIAMGRLAVVFEDLQMGRLIDVFQRYTRSPASYWYVSAHGQGPSSAALEQWLTDESAQFMGERRAWSKKIPVMTMPKEG